MTKKDVEIDPEFLDVLIQSISVLSNVATLASAWLLLRDRVVGSPGHFGDSDAVRQQLRMLRRGLEDTFEAVEAVLRILEEGRARSGKLNPLAEPTRFGSGVILTGEEFGRAQAILELAGKLSIASTHCWSQPALDDEFRQHGLYAQCDLRS